MSVNFQSHLKKLNPEQLQAVQTIDGPVMVISGPGTGKTQILSLRVANILQKTDTTPSQILCLTFTDSAAQNLKKRLISIIGKAGYQVQIFTFHSLAVEIINNYPHKFFHGADFVPVDEVSKIEIMQDILQNLKYDNPLRIFHPEKGWIYLNSLSSKINQLKKEGLSSKEFKQILQSNSDFFEKTKTSIHDFFSKRISLKLAPNLQSLILEIEKFEKGTEQKQGYKNVILNKLRKIQSDLESENLASLKEFKKKNIVTQDGQKVLKDLQNLPRMQALADFYAQFQQKMYQAGFFDFADMILEVNSALENDLDFQLDLAEQFDYFLIDEFQDTNGSQLRLVDNLVKAETQNFRPNVFVVGDDDQAIFKFQGASSQNLIDFEAGYKNVQKIVLTKNYRSKEEIIDFANQLITKAEDRFSDQMGIDKVQVVGG